MTDDEATTGLAHPQEALAELRRLARRLLSLAVEIQAARVHHSEDDDLAFVYQCFTRKQAEHFTSTSILIGEQQSRDAELIVRSMFEGLVQLLWALKDRAARPHLWRAFACIQDWRQLKKRLDAGQSVGATRREEIERQVAAFGPEFLTKKARKAQGEGRPLPRDPYRQDWHGRSVRAMLDEVELPVDFYDYYGELSEWTHWSPRGLGFALERQGDRVVYCRPPVAAAIRAWFFGGQALLYTLVLSDNYLGLGFAERLAKLRADFQDWRSAAMGVG